MALIAPFGAVGGFVTVALSYQLAKAGASTEAVGAMIALSYLPHTWKFLWAPVVDLVGTRRQWCAWSTGAMALGFVAMGAGASDAQDLNVLTLLVVLANLASTFSAMGVESLMAHTTPDHLRGRVAGLFQAGNLGGNGIGGGLALWLLRDLQWSGTEAGLTLALLCALCMGPLLLIREPTQEPHARATTDTLWMRLRAQARQISAEMLSMVRSRPGLLAMAVCFLPIGSGAASNLWSSVAGDWGASDDTVALVNGALSGVISALGCVAGGRICDRLPRRLAYCIFGLLQALLALGMSVAPTSEPWFVFFVCAYSFAVGMSYAAFSCLVLETIGLGAAATKYNVLASLSNMPVAYVTYLDGWAHEHHGAAAMLRAEAAAGLLGLLVFAALVACWSSAPAATTRRVEGNSS